MNDELCPGDLCVVVNVGGSYCRGFGPGTIVTLAVFERFYYERRWRCSNRSGDTAWALPQALRKLPPDQFTACDADFDWLNISRHHEVATT
jgi:hypothetical protein